MDKEQTKAKPVGPNEHRRYRARLPGFIGDEEVGLGNVIKRVTSVFGIRPCSACERRAATLNHWLVFTGRRKS